MVDQILESTPDEIVNPLNAAAFGFMLGELANKENETLNHEKIEEYIFGSDLEESRKQNFMDITMAVVGFYEKAGLGGYSKKEVDDIMRRTGRDRIMYYSSTPQMANIIYGMLNLPYRRGDTGDLLLMRLTNLLPHIEALVFAINNEAVSEARIRRLI